MSTPGVVRPLAIASFLVSGAVASAQYVPIRGLDSNGLLVNEGPNRIAGARVVGSGRTSATSTWSPVVWDAKGSSLLPLLVGTDSGYATAADPSGTVVGTVYDSTRLFSDVATIWSGGVAIDLATLVTSGGPATLYWANDIDERGRIVVDGIVYGSYTRGWRTYLFDGGTLLDLGVLDPSSSTSSAVALNDRGVAAGWSTFGPNSHACLFENGHVTDLHVPVVMKDTSSATALNRHGWVVGSYSKNPILGGTPETAFLWDGSAITDLSALSPPMRRALAINDFGVAVGATYTAVSTPVHACSYENGVVTDLNTLVDPALGWLLVVANDIDNEGRITGTGTLNGVDAGWILEPDCKGTFTLYGHGCAGTAGVEPRLVATGCPAPDRPFAFEVRDGLANGLGFLFLGLGNGTIQVRPGCDLQVAPLTLPIVPLLLDGLGGAWLEERLPVGTPTFDLNLQALCFDPGAARGLSATKPVALHFE